MMRAARTRHIREQGFTLIETLAAMALTGLIVSALATMTSQWLPNWNRGFDRIQRSEAISMALDRIGADIGASEYVRPDRQSRNVLFEGSESSVTLARASFGPNAGRGLELVHVSQATDRNGIALMRSRSAFVPGAEMELKFTDPVVLLHGPYRFSFSYAGSDKVWKDAWRESEQLPAAVLVTVRNAVTGRTLPISRIAVIHISAPADSVCAQPEGSKCDAKPAPLADGAARNQSSADAGR